MSSHSSVSVQPVLSICPETAVDEILAGCGGISQLSVCLILSSRTCHYSSEICSALDELQKHVGMGVMEILPLSDV